MCQMEEIEFNFDLTPKPVLKLLYVLLHVQSRVCLFQEIVYWFYVESSLPKARPIHIRNWKWQGKMQNMCVFLYSNSLSKIEFLPSRASVNVLRYKWACYRIHKSWRFCSNHFYEFHLFLFLKRFTLYIVARHSRLRFEMKIWRQVIYWPLIG